MKTTNEPTPQWERQSPCRVCGNYGVIGTGNDYDYQVYHDGVNHSVEINGKGADSAKGGWEAMMTPRPSLSPEKLPAPATGTDEEIARKIADKAIRYCSITENTVPQSRYSSRPPTPLPVAVDQLAGIILAALRQRETFEEGMEEAAVMCDRRSVIARGEYETNLYATLAAAIRAAKGKGASRAVED